MTRRLIAAAALLATVAGALPATAADLYRDTPDRYGSAYEDPRYADLYGRAPPPPPPIYEPPRRDYGYNHVPIPKEPVYRDYNGRYPRYAEAHPPRAYSYTPTPPSRAGCIPKDEVRFELQREGWADFHDAQIIDRYNASVKARRQGRLFELKVDRCTGEVVASRPLEPRYGPRADYAPPPPPYGGYRRYYD